MRRRPAITFNLTGWKAWAVIAVMGLLAVGRYDRVHDDLPTAVEQIRPFLKGDYLKQVLAARTEEERYEPLGPVELTFAEVDVAGAFSGRPVVRVKPLLNGAPPPDGREYRYYAMNYSIWSGFYAPFETGETAYDMSFF